MPQAAANHWQQEEEKKDKKKKQTKKTCICFFSLEVWLDTFNVLANTESEIRCNAYYETYTMFSL